MIAKIEKLLSFQEIGLLLLVFCAVFMPGTGESSNIPSPGIAENTQLGNPWHEEAQVTDNLLFQSAYVFDYGDPTAAEQAHLEAINRARMNPAGEASRLGINLFEGVPSGEISGTAVQPLVFNSKLIQAARSHSQDMIDHDYFAHNSLNGLTPFDRMTGAGYVYSYAGENISFIGSSGSIDEVATVLQHHDNLFIDDNYPGRGHRVNILNENFKEVGVGSAFGEYEIYTNSYMLTCDFGRSQQFFGSFILGVVYDDNDGDNFYDAGEGMGMVSITLTETGATTVTAAAGGYGIPVNPGSYTMLATLSDGSYAQQQVTINNENKKIDFLKSDFIPAAASPVTVGDAPGIHDSYVSASQTLSLMVNVTNAAGETPIYEWIWFMMIINGNPTPVYALTGSGWQEITNVPDLVNLTYAHGATTILHLGDISMAELGMGSGDSLIYGYAYSMGSVFELVVENMVTLKVE